jgi:hypothetical protein
MHCQNHDRAQKDEKYIDPNLHRFHSETSFEPAPAHGGTGARYQDPCQLGRMSDIPGKSVCCKDAEKISGIAWGKLSAMSAGNCL